MSVTDDPRTGVSTSDSPHLPTQHSIGPEILAVLDALPNPLVLVDRWGVVGFCSLGVASMLGRARDETTGVALESLVDPRDHQLLRGLLDVPREYRDRTIGPSRIRCLDASGSPRWTQLWGRTAPPEFGTDGFLLTVTPESVRDVLLTAVSPVVVDQQLDTTLGHVAASVSAAPIGGVGSILAVLPVAADDPARFRPTGSWPLDDASLNAFGTPWRQALVEETAIDVEDIASAGMSPQARNALLAHGFRSTFMRPIRDVSDSIVGVLVVFRESDEPIGIAHAAHLDDVARFAGLAFAQAHRITELENAAQRDALTGVLNRAALLEQLESDPRPADILRIDLDHLTSVNETFGHDHGDAVIVEAAERVRAAVGRDDEVYRIGGDEFLVVRRPATGGLSELGSMAERIVDRLMAPFDVEEHRIRIGASVGVAAGRNRSLADSVDVSQTALDSAKERGRAGFVVAPDESGRSTIADGPWHAAPTPIPSPATADGGAAPVRPRELLVERTDDPPTDSPTSTRLDAPWSAPTRAMSGVVPLAPEPTTDVAPDASADEAGPSPEPVETPTLEVSATADPTTGDD
ncbi:MAG: diguanylate cyclase [Actinomycetota bacterium]